MKRRALPKCVTGLAFVAIIIAQLIPSSSAKSQLARQFRVPKPHESLNNLPVLADFDGDQRLDRAELHLAGAHRCVLVRFGNSLESHLDFRDFPQALGTLLTRDINQDNKPDLVWVPRFQSERAVVWFGDGLGHFMGAASTNTDDGLRTLLFGDSDPAILDAVKDEQVFLTPDPPSSDLARAANLEPVLCHAILISGGNDRRDLGLYLFYLRERGPPLHTSFV
jgi:hypothetical protein